MAKQIAQDVWDRMVAAYRERPGNSQYVAQAVGVTWRTAKRAWEKGWVPKLPWAKPIRRMLEEEAEAARAERFRREQALLEQEAQRRLQARLDAIEARAEEADGAKRSRRNALALAIVTGKVLVAANTFADELQARAKAQGGLGAVPLGEIRRTLLAASQMAHRAEAVMRLALEIERIATGEPIATVGVRVDTMTPEQKVRELERVAKTLERAAALGRLGREGTGTGPRSEDLDGADPAPKAN